MNDDNSPGKRRRRSVRLPTYDYSAPGSIFVTACTKEFRHTLGKIIDGDVQLSALGRLVQSEWDVTVEMRQEMIAHAFVILPNHIHALVSLTPHDGWEPQRSDPVLLHQHRRPHSISTIIGAFKGAVTRCARQQLGRPDLEVWHRSFHDRVVCNEKEFEAIFNYIWENPERWERDRFNTADCAVKQTGQDVTDRAR